MKRTATLLLVGTVWATQAHAMTRTDTSRNAGNTAPAATRQTGRVDAIYAGAGKVVIGGVTYAYNPLTTVVTVNGKRATVSDVRVGETLEFRATPQGAHQPDLLTSISVQRK